MITTTIYCKLLAKESDVMNYQTLVFRNLEKAPFGQQYIMVTVWPNWESRIPEIEEKGYLTYDFVQAGIDTFYDRTIDSDVKYKFTNLVFKKFVKELDNSTKDIIL